MPDTTPSNIPGWTKVEVDLGDGELTTVDLPPLKGKSKVPPTVAKDGMDQYQAARELRIITKTAAPPSATAVTMQLHLLRNKLTVRATKVERLAQLDAVLKEFDAHTNAIKQQYGRIAVLTQNLPTVKHLPVGNDENIVRAFIAILKSNGRV